MSTIPPIRPAAPPRPVRPVLPGVPSPTRPRPALAATGKVDDRAKVAGLIAGTAAGAGGAAALSLLWLIGGSSVPPVGWAAMAAATLLGTGLGYMGGDRLGDWLEQTPARGSRYMPAQLLGGAAGGVLGLAGGFWLGFFTLGTALGSPLFGLLTAVPAAALGAIGGAEGAKRLCARLFG